MVVVLPAEEGENLTGGDFEAHAVDGGEVGEFAGHVLGANHGSTPSLRRRQGRR
jgi:hypothetical protein